MEMNKHNKIFFISILSTIFTVQLIFAQGFNEAGYDVHKGPVFYEAYYYPEKQNFHKRRSIEMKDEDSQEKITQISNTPNVMISIDGNEVIVIGDKLTRIPLLGVRTGVNNWNEEKRRINQDYVRRIHEKRLKQTANDNKMSEATLENNGEKFSLTSRFQRTANPSYSRNENSNFLQLENKLPLNVNFNKDSIPSQYPMNYNAQNENFNFDNSGNQNYNFINGNNMEFYNRENENLPNESLGKKNFESKGSQDFSESLQENIFEPRPQIIKYLFSAPRENGFGTKKSNFINNDAQIDGVIKEPGIASIEVSEEPRHKIRHHHGERLRRNYSRQ